jgi:Ca2+-binding RTX toxin-like protein
VIDGRGGDDVIDVGRGDDTAIGGTGDDIIDGGEGFDVAVFAGNSADYTITVTSQDGSTVTVVGPDGEDTLIDVELLRFDDEDILVSSFILSASDDIADLPALNGTVTVDVLANDNAGLAAGVPSVASVSDGKFGTATIGADGQITYTATAEATGGFDVISYTIVDSEGRMATAEVLIGDISGPDASADAAILLGDDGVTFVGSGGEEIIIGGLGDDTITGKGGDDAIDGGAGNDEISGSAGNDTIIGGDGDDKLSGNLGNDLISGGAGNDEIAGSGDDDQIIGGDGDDVISANPGDDFIFAGAGDDFVSGNAGNELIFAGQGNDEIKRIGEGQDTAFGGDGDDVFIWRSFQADNERDLIDGQSGLDTLELEVDAADFAAVQVEVDAYHASLATNASDTNGVTSSYSFTTIALDIANVESIDLTFG